jgi:hypothetical protein
VTEIRSSATEWESNPTDQRIISQAGNVSRQLRRCVWREHVGRETCKTRSDQSRASVIVRSSLGLLSANDLLPPVTRNLAGAVHDSGLTHGGGSFIPARAERSGRASTAPPAGSSSATGHRWAAGSGQVWEHARPPTASSLRRTRTPPPAQPLQSGL